MNIQPCAARIFASLRPCTGNRDAHIRSPSGQQQGATYSTTQHLDGHASRTLGLIRTGTSARIYAYCLMPDHVHLLIGVPEGFSLSELVRNWKSRCYVVRRRL